MLGPQISGLDEFRDHLVGKRNAFTHLLWSALYLDRPTGGRATSVPRATDFGKAASAAGYERRKPQARVADAPGAPLVETAG
jgi:hypothetical protein